MAKSQDVNFWRKPIIDEALDRPELLRTTCELSGVTVVNPVPPNLEVDRQQRLLLASDTENVKLVGRLATYRCYNMDQVVGQALVTYRWLKPQLMDVADADNISEDHAVRV